MKRLTFLALGLFVAAASCDRITYYPDDPVLDVRTRILAHRGGGSAYAGNDMASCKYGLSKVDGIEVDIQRSEENDLWLSHSSDVPICGALGGDCFASTKTASIINIDSCLGPDVNLTTLDSLFKFVKAYYPDKYISLDVKAWSPCDIASINITRQMNELAEKIISLTRFYGLEHQVMVESETGDFLYYIKENSDFIETYLTSFGDFELAASSALDAGFDGISYKFKFGEELVREQVDLLHRKGLKIQLWTIVGEDNFNEASSLGADFIQTDDL